MKQKWKLKAMEKFTSKYKSHKWQNSKEAWVNKIKKESAVKTDKLIQKIDCEIS